MLLINVILWYPEIPNRTQVCKFQTELLISYKPKEKLHVRCSICQSRGEKILAAPRQRPVHMLPARMWVHWSIKRQSRLQQTTNFATSLLIFEKIRYDISWELSASKQSSWNIMPYFLFLKKAAKFLIVVCCKFKLALYGLNDFAVFMTDLGVRVCWSIYKSISYYFFNIDVTHSIVQSTQTIAIFCKIYILYTVDSFFTHLGDREYEV